MDKNIANELRKILTKLERIEQKFNTPSLDDYISEFEAKKLFKKGTTWFWQQRQSGLQFTKLGAEVFYRRADLISWMENNFQGG